MEDCLFGLVHLQENNMVHADLRPSLIGVPVARGQNFILLDRLGDPSPPNQAQLNNLKAGKKLYMSPALYHALMNKQPKVRHNPFKSDIFSLGMIILEAGLLEPVQGIYSAEGKEIDHSALVDLVERFFQRYPSHFILQEMLLVMLEFSEKLRQEPIKLLKTLQSLKVSELEDSQMMSMLLQQKKAGDSSHVLITSSGFQLKDSRLANLTLLHGPQDKVAVRENHLKQSLVEMLRNRTSHNESKQMYLVDELPEKTEFDEDYQIDENSLVDLPENTSVNLRIH